MQLSLNALEQQAKDLRAADVQLPSFDVAQMQQKGRETPRWLHFGPGNLFRVFPARIADDMLAADQFWPITTAETYGEDSRKQLRDFDGLTLSVTLLPDGSTQKRVIASICETLISADAPDRERLTEVFTAETLTTVSFTITEKGYVIENAGGLLPPVAAAIQAGPEAESTNAMVILASLLYARFSAGAAGINLVSMDNFSHNGDKLRESVLRIAKGWVDNGRAEAEFLAWVSDPARVAFPISVIDKITPRPSQPVADQLERLGFTNLQIDTSGPVPLAGFVNTEAPEYLIIEDAFASGVERPPFEEHGVQIVEREVCDRFETMKVTTCLNPLHTALALSGCLLGFSSIDAAISDQSLANFVHRLAWDEGMKVVVDPGIVSPADFLQEVEQVRLTNPYLPDAPERIAMDTSQKLAIRFGHTVRSYQDQGLSLEPLVAIPLVYALWLRYLLAVNDRGEAISLAPDPRAEEMREALAGVELGGSFDQERVRAILADTQICGLNLNETELADRIIGYFEQLISAPGQVRQLLDELFLNGEGK